MRCRTMAERTLARRRSRAQARAGPQTVCTITVNSADEKEAFHRRLPKGQFRFVELVEKGRADWLASACEKAIACDVLVVSAQAPSAHDYIDFIRLLGSRASSGRRSPPSYTRVWGWDASPVRRTACDSGPAGQYAMTNPISPIATSIRSAA